jgi:TolA-binding protein
MKRTIVASVIVVLLLGGGIAVWLLTRGPQTAEEQIAYAEERLDELLKEKELPPEEIPAERGEVLKEFEKVYEEFPPGPEAPKAHRRIAELKERWNDLEGAFEDYRSFGEKYPKDAAAEDMHWKAAEMADERLGKTEEAIKLYAEFLERFPESKRSEEASWRIISLRLALGEDAFPPGDVLEALGKFLEKYPDGKHAAEARLMLGDTYAGIKEWEAAVREYDAVIDKYEGSPESAKALYAKGEILDRELDRKKEAQEAFKKLEEKHPDTPEARRGGASRQRIEKNLDEDAAKEREQKYVKERYGRSPGDLFRAVRGTAPADFVRDLLTQDIDIETVTLDAALHPGKRALNGTCELVVVIGEKERKSLLLQIMMGTDVKSVTVDGKDAKFTCRGERIAVTLPSPAAPGAKLTVSINYALEDLPEHALLTVGETGHAVPGAMWYPFTVYGDLFTGRATFRLPKKFRLIGCGAPVEEKEDGEVRVSTWEMKSPVFGLFFAYGEFEEATDGPVTVYAKDEARAKEFAALAKEIIDFYGGRFGALPYGGVRIVETDLPPMLGGVSPASLILLNREFLQETGSPVSLLAHELSHQWWGNVVPVTLMDEEYAPNGAHEPAPAEGEPDLPGARDDAPRHPDRRVLADAPGVLRRRVHEGRHHPRDAPPRGGRRGVLPGAEEIRLRLRLPRGGHLGLPEDLRGGVGEEPEGLLHAVGPLAGLPAPADRIGGPLGGGGRAQGGGEGGPEAEPALLDRARRRLPRRGGEEGRAARAAGGERGDDRGDAALPAGAHRARPRQPDPEASGRRQRLGKEVTRGEGKKLSIALSFLASDFSASGLLKK